jgi:hypothetical protein
MSGDRSKACRLIEAFRANVGTARPNDCDVVRIDFLTNYTEALVIGTLDAVKYSVEGAELPFFHQFQKNDRPLLLCSPDGRQIFVAQGRYRFTDRGFLR